MDAPAFTSFRLRTKYSLKRTTRQIAAPTIPPTVPRINPFFSFDADAGFEADEIVSVAKRVVLEMVLVGVRAAAFTESKQEVFELSRTEKAELVNVKLTFGTVMKALYVPAGTATGDHGNGFGLPPDIFARLCVRLCRSGLTLVTPSWSVYEAFPKYAQGNALDPHTVVFCTSIATATKGEAELLDTIAGGRRGGFMATRVRSCGLSGDSY